MLRIHENVTLEIVREFIRLFGNSFRAIHLGNRQDQINPIIFSNALPGRLHMQFCEDNIGISNRLCQNVSHVPV